jgi:DNA-binding transcriptional ArsR family regulator
MAKRRNRQQVNTYHEAQLDALGDATRRAILERLVTGPLAVGELAREFPMSRPAISQHLRVLKRAHLVTDRAAGTRRLYAVNPDAIEALRQYSDRFSAASSCSAHMYWHLLDRCLAFIVTSPMGALPLEGNIDQRVTLLAHFGLVGV